MMDLKMLHETRDIKARDSEGFKKIQPESKMSGNEARSFWDDVFRGSGEGKGIKNSELIENEQKHERRDDKQDIKVLTDDYAKDLKDRSPCPDTLPDKPFSPDDLEKRSPEENANERQDFDEKKSDLKKQWEELHDRPWPKYEHDVYSENGKLIRKAGTDYDAHHIHPLSLGGKNEVSNITPMHASDHYDKQGIHAPNSPYSKLESSRGGYQ